MENRKARACEGDFREFFSVYVFCVLFKLVGVKNGTTSGGFSSSFKHNYKSVKTSNFHV